LYESVKYLDHFVLEEGLNSCFLSIADENHKYTELVKKITGTNTPMIVTNNFRNRKDFSASRPL